MDEIANLFPGITGWLLWWDVRWYHIFLAFRWFGYSNITLAESSNARLKCWTQLWLLEVMWDDTAFMLTQIEELKSFIAQTATSSGKGRSSMTQDRANRSTQIHATEAYITKFTNKCTWQETLWRTTIYMYLCQPVVWGTDHWKEEHRRDISQ